MGLNGCGVEDPACLGSTCNDGVDCDKCMSNEGPGGANGCYWDPVLQGSCAGEKFYWSSSEYEFGTGGGYAWWVHFQSATINPTDVNFPRRARCVRGGG